MSGLPSIIDAAYSGSVFLELLEAAGRPAWRMSIREVRVQGFQQDSMEVALQGGGLDVRVEDAGGMSVGMFRLPAGTDLRPALKGLEGDLCQCPHWGYMLKGTLRMHTATGVHEYPAGQAFYWAPGHAPEALDDVEYVDFSPTAELHTVLDHVKQQSAP